MKIRRSFGPALTLVSLCYTQYMHYVYVLQARDKSLYFGYTSNLRRRLREHQTGRSKYTKGMVWKLVYYESYASESDARKREERIKLHGQAKAQLKRRIKDCLSHGED